MSGAYIHLDFTAITAESDKALLVLLEDAEEAIWLPKSQIADADDYSKGDENGTISITRWLAEQKKLV